MVDPTVSAGLLAASDRKLRAVLEALGVDYVCSGERSLADAAAAEGIGVDRILAALSHESGTVAEPPPSWFEATLPELAGHIREDVNPCTLDLLAGAAFRFEGVGAAFFSRERETFRELVRSVTRHIEREERELLPLLDANRRVPHGLVFESFLEHEKINSLLRKLRDRGPLTAALDEQLTRIERHLHETMNFENFILIPRALDELEPAHC
jgi:regulator of cell morphogenesis and NO signaling